MSLWSWWLERRRHRRQASVDEAASILGWPMCESCGHAVATNAGCSACRDNSSSLGEALRACGISGEEFLKSARRIGEALPPTTVATLDR